ncbi:MAG: hypothetical protein RMI91_00445 [Gemmatales bacterium]|nr:hypothetical protein [Gemmatales bacterium]MDW7993100.1 hypothetical protein [Gemmatales bacterium]
MARTTESRRSQAMPVYLHEEPMYLKYSAHHELPLSLGSAVLLHLFLILGFAVLAAYGGCGLWSYNPPPPELDVVDAGGGGEGDNSPPDAVEDSPIVDQPQVPEKPADKPPEVNPPETVIPDKPPEQPPPNRPQGKPGDVGRGGPGTGGGLGSGTGPGIGSGVGPGVQTVRARRMHRWKMVMPYASSREYLNRLIELQAILVIPRPDGLYLFYRELGNRNLKPTLEGQDALSALSRRLIHWTDDNPQSVAALAHALNLDFTPKRAFVFFPVELERALAERELKYRGLTEEEIDKRQLITIFRVRRVGNNYQIEIIDQRPRRPGE